MSVGRLGLVILLSAVSLQVTGEEQGGAQVTQRQSTAQEQAGSRNDPGAAGEQQRIQAAEQQQQRVVEQAQPAEASKHRSKHGNQTGASGHSGNKGYNARPSGSKNKPQKSGR